MRGFMLVVIDILTDTVAEEAGIETECGKKELGYYNKALT